MIELSVALPMFNAGNIGWLALESLIRQKGINFEWELIIAEEQNEEMMGYDNIFKYKPLLNDVGCVNINYIPIKDKIYLPTKWILMANATSESSKIYTCMAADTFYYPQRLKTEFDFVSDGCDWAASMLLPHYIISTDEIYVADYNRLLKKNKGAAVGMFFSTYTEYVKNIREIKNKTSGIDGWLFRSISNYVTNQKKEFIIKYDESDNWKYGFATHGFNTISIKRYKHLKEHYNKDDNLREFWPEDVMEKIYILKEKSRLD